jgi:hypothetical protein
VFNSSSNSVEFMHVNYHDIMFVLCCDEYNVQN